MFPEPTDDFFMFVPLGDLKVLGCDFFAYGEAKTGRLDRYSARSNDDSAF